MVAGGLGVKDLLSWGWAGSGWADEKRAVLASFQVHNSAFSVARRFDVMAAAGTIRPGSGLLKSGPCWRIPRCTIRRFLLRDGLK